MMAMGSSLDPRYALFAAGMVSKGSVGSGSLDGGFGEVVLATILGAFAGLLCGLVLSQLVRFCSFLRGRQTNGHVWTMVSMVVGAGVFACWALLENGEVEPLPPANQGLAER